MAKSVVLFDCEFLTAHGAMRRLWAGPFDPDPLVVQIGAVKLSLEPDFPVLDTIRLYIRPIDRLGRQIPLDPYFIELTGITEQDLARKGTDLGDALRQLDRFSDHAPLFSWGKDEQFLFGISCYVAGIRPNMAAGRFDNACKLALKAGMSYSDVQTTRSGGLADFFDAPHPVLRGHDALDDALSIAYAFRHLLTAGVLVASDFENPAVELDCPAE